MNRKSPNNLYRVFAIPLAIAAVSLIGLVAALLGDDVFDLTSWIGLAIPVAVIAWAMLRRRG